jgi:hypothetical protein
VLTDGGANVLHALSQDIYEEAVGDAYPVVRHTFFGKTPEEARGYYNAHLGTCAFMRGCTQEGRWNDVVCRTEEAETDLAKVPPLRGAPVCINEAQRTLHVVSEAGAVVLVAPLMAYLATRKQLPTWARAGAGAVGVLSVLIDGYLLTRYLTR